MSEYDAFVERLEEIRRLSSPSMKGIPDAEKYCEQLQQNFLRIGQLAQENRRFLNAVFFPTVQAHRQLSSDETTSLLSFSGALLSAVDVENLDLALMSLVSEKLLDDAEQGSDLALTIQRLDIRMDTCYALMSMMGRSRSAADISGRFRQEGLRIGHFFLQLLEHDRFERLLDASCREIILTDVRYMAVFYEGLAADDPLQLEEPAPLDRILALADDPFYHRLTPDMNWPYFRYRALNYYARMTDLCNARGFDADALQNICDKTEAFAQLWHSDAPYFSQYDNEKQVRMLLYRNRYLAGRISAAAYREELLSLYRRRDPDQYDLNGIYDNLQIPAEAICLYHPEDLSPREARMLAMVYRNMIQYAFRMPNGSSLSSLLEYYIHIIDRFIEVPGGITFEDMMLNCMAALHPPTYVHSVMVAKITRCLCSELIDHQPALLVGALGCATPGDVLLRREEICEFAYHAGLCHDFGKLPIIDTIFVYGRNLFDLEFDLIKTHPLAGRELLSRYNSTRVYADVAAGHHRWYDNSRGYPEGVDTSQNPIKPIIDLVLCADCMDAATDSVGRSYRAGKTFNEFCREIRPELGTHYAPWLWPLLNGADSSIRNLLKNGRKETYRNTYYLLREMTSGVLEMPSPSEIQ